jgi:2,4-dienoyl-CoA reductase-like NADH-dependent reductase (Old Yellow Enzyme family)
MKFGDFVKVKGLESAAGFRENLQRLGLDMPCDDEVALGAASPLAQPLQVHGWTIGNRWCVQPMEGWDGQADGRPSENTLRRWRHFGASGAKLVWGGEAVAVRHDGRANPQQLVLNEHTQGDIARLREALIAEHRQAMGSDAGLVIGLQLTHSGRFCKPNDPSRMEPQVLFRHPLLDGRFGPAERIRVMDDGDIRALIDDFVVAAKRARDIGFDFVDLKHCHGYLGHEFLAAKTRPGDYGGPLENRTRFLRELVAGIRAEAPGLEMGVRLSAFDFLPYRPDPARSTAELLGPGVPVDFGGALPYRYGFGPDEQDPTRSGLEEAMGFIEVAQSLGIRLFNITLGSPYYNPHLTRPALYPPSDGYQPPEDPLVGVMRHLAAVRDLKRRFPSLLFAGSGYTYLQEFLPQVAQAVVREGWTDFVGLGRLMLSYPDLPADLLAGRPMQRKRLCRTFSDCTTAPRNGMVSGCYPLDAHYKKSPQMAQLTLVKKAARLA